jgi:multidrug efflux pump subunit AcrB
MNLSRFFIDRPIFAGVISVLIFVAGLLALRAMPISEYPRSRRRPSWCARSIRAPTRR